MHDMTARVAAISAHNRSPNFLKHQRWYPTIYDLRRGAAKRLPRFAYEYGDGGAGDDTGIKHNWAALDAIEMIPRYGVMRERDVSELKGPRCVAQSRILRNRVEGETANLRLGTNSAVRFR